jgi:MacB-like periplasmic core domain/FtsX-like permease family
VNLKRIDHAYLGITGQRIATGRNFSTEEISQVANVVLINAHFARLLAREGGVLGTLLSRGDDTPHTVIGVVDELAYAGTLANTPRIYLPASEAGSNFIIKFRPGYWLSREQLVAFLSGVNSGFGVFLYDDLSQQRSEILLPRQITATAASIVALIVVLVSAIGLFGMVSYTTSLRRAEIGARLVFGARARHIVLMLVRNNLAAVLIGCVLSALLAWLVLPGVPLWFDFRPVNVDWADAALALSSLGVVVAIACYLSARPVVSQSQASALRDSV